MISKDVDPALLAKARLYFPKRLIPNTVCPLCRIQISAAPVQVLALRNTIARIIESTRIHERHSSVDYVYGTGSFEDVF